MSGSRRGSARNLRMPAIFRHGDRSLAEAEWQAGIIGAADSGYADRRMMSLRGAKAPKGLAVLIHACPA